MEQSPGWRGDGADLIGGIIQSGFLIFTVHRSFNFHRQNFKGPFHKKNPRKHRSLSCSIVHFGQTLKKTFQTITKTTTTESLCSQPPPARPPEKLGTFNKIPSRGVIRGGITSNYQQFWPVMMTRGVRREFHSSADKDQSHFPAPAR